jgi:hypothetical protein
MDEPLVADQSQALEVVAAIGSPERVTQLLIGDLHPVDFQQAGCLFGEQDILVWGEEVKSTSRARVSAKCRRLCSFPYDG